MPRLEDILARYPRVAITGGPVTGKSWITDRVTDRPVIHSDHLAHDGGFSQHSADVKTACEGLDRFVVAGIAADRAVRKGLEVDAVIHCSEAQTRLSKGQEVLKKQIDRRVMELADRGMAVYRFAPPRKG